jgi:vacuolar-type H+-ATPase subunit I/STV1
LATSTKKAIKQLAATLAVTLFVNKDDVNDNTSSNENETHADAAVEQMEVAGTSGTGHNAENAQSSVSSIQFLQEKLRAKIVEFNHRPNNQETEGDIAKQVKQELLLYEATSKLGPLLEKLLKSLKTIQPTSTESERVFSLSSNFCTKKRSSLGDNSLNALCFLKTFFLNNRYID